MYSANTSSKKISICRFVLKLGGLEAEKSNFVTKGVVQQRGRKNVIQTLFRGVYQHEKMVNGRITFSTASPTAF